MTSGWGSLEFTFTGFNSLPNPFAVSIKPRSPAHAAVIRREHEDAQGDFAQYHS